MRGDEGESDGNGGGTRTGGNPGGLGSRGPPRPGAAAGAVSNSGSGRGREMRPGMQQWLKIRSDSVGSTRGAFTQNDKSSVATVQPGGANDQKKSVTPSNTSPRKKRQSKVAKSTGRAPRSPPKMGTPTVNAPAQDEDNSLSLADAAALAFTQLRDGVGGAVVSQGSIRENFTPTGQPPLQGHSQGYSGQGRSYHANQQKAGLQGYQAGQAPGHNRIWSGSQSDSNYSTGHHHHSSGHGHPFSSHDASGSINNNSNGGSRSDSFNRADSLEFSNQNLNMSADRDSSIRGTDFLFSAASLMDIERGPSNDSDVSGKGSNTYGSMKQSGSGAQQNNVQYPTNQRGSMPGGSTFAPMSGTGRLSQHHQVHQHPGTMYGLPQVGYHTQGPYFPHQQGGGQYNATVGYPAYGQSEYQQTGALEGVNSEVYGKEIEFDKQSAYPMKGEEDCLSVILSNCRSALLQIRSGLYKILLQQNDLTYNEEGEAEEHVGFFTYVFRSLLYNHVNPEFTSLQQFCWAVLLGVFMGVATALWGKFIEGCVDLVWRDIPQRLKGAGLFTEADGMFPLVHYMWICPAIFGGTLAYITSKLPMAIPGQNEWIESLHRQGVLDHGTFWYILTISTAGMASGLSLGPELPLVLLGGMVGSFLAKLTRQSVLSARAINLTAVSAAIGGFFGFPMAGALFALEIPHRMGLQYFEALSPATISSIVSVLVNRIVTGNDVKGYYDYPFLSATLPSRIFYIAILYGLVGSFAGIFYAKGCMKIKGPVHDWLHHHEHSHHETPPITESPAPPGDETEQLPLIGKADHKHHDAKKKPASQLRSRNTLMRIWNNVTSFEIKRKPLRSTVIGIIAGIMTGTVCIFLPHSLFWGEAQLQTLIDNGRTRLPVFYSEEGGPMETTDLVQYGFCMVEPKDAAAGYSATCSALLLVAKVVVNGLSLGTGIIGGHFWGPLYVGATAANLFIKLMEHAHEWLELGANSPFDIVFAHPCVALLCIMGSAHVVTFRAHTAIMLILTLTISAFTPDSSNYVGEIGGDYSAVFPLLVVSCFVSLMFTRSTVFYKAQRSRGDIIASPEVLCEPGKLGQPEYPMHQLADDSQSDSMYEDDDGTDDMLETSWGEKSDDAESLDDPPEAEVASPQELRPLKTVQSQWTSADIEREFASMQQSGGQSLRDVYSSAGKKEDDDSNGNDDVSENKENDSIQEETKDDFQARGFGSSRTAGESRAPPRVPNSKIDEILAAPIEPIRNRRKNIPSNSRHRRIQSGSDVGSYSSHRENEKLGTDDSRLRASSFDRGEPAATQSAGHSRNSSNIGSRPRANSRDRSSGGTPAQPILSKVNSFGELGEFQPDLMNQARMRASSAVRNPVPPMVPKSGHWRKASGSGSNAPSQVGGEIAGAISQEDIERAFSSVTNQSNLENDSQLFGRGNNFVRRRVGTDPHG